MNQNKPLICHSLTCPFTCENEQELTQHEQTHYDWKKA